MDDAKLLGRFSGYPHEIARDRDVAPCDAEDDHGWVPLVYDRVPRTQPHKVGASRFCSGPAASLFHGVSTSIWGPRQLLSGAALEVAWKVGAGRQDFCDLGNSFRRRSLGTASGQGGSPDGAATCRMGDQNKKAAAN